MTDDVTPGQTDNRVDFADCPKQMLRGQFVAGSGIFQVSNLTPVWLGPFTVQRDDDADTPILRDGKE